MVTGSILIDNLVFVVDRIDMFGGQIFHYESSFSGALIVV
jgi:hypothetical protein